MCYLQFCVLKIGTHGSIDRPKFHSVNLSAKQTNVGRFMRKNTIQKENNVKHMSEWPKNMHRYGDTMDADRTNFGSYPHMAHK